MEFRIAEARHAKGWSQERLAEATGLSQQAIQRYEAGTREPKISSIVKISAALGVTITYLLGLDSEVRGAYGAAAREAATPADSRLRRICDCYAGMDEAGRTSLADDAENILIRHPVRPQPDGGMPADEALAAPRLPVRRPWQRGAVSEEEATLAVARGKPGSPERVRSRRGGERSR